FFALWLNQSPYNSPQDVCSCNSRRICKKPIFHHSAKASLRAWVKPGMTKTVMMVLSQALAKFSLQQ
ncbi:MAG: hypothetical protein PVF79_11245, partial [Desulfobacterales bacterium]